MSRQKVKKKSGKNLRKSGKSQGKIREFDGINKVGTLNEMFKLLSPLCGKLMQKNKRIQFEMPRNLGKSASPEIDNGKDNAIKTQKRCSLLQENRALNVPTETTSTFNGTDTVDGSEADDKTTESPLFEDISMDEGDASDEKATENALVPENVYGEMLRRVNDLIAQVGPLKVSAERSGGSLPSMITATPHPPTDINSFYQQENKDVINIQPTVNATTGVPSANHTSTLTQLKDNVVRNNHPAHNGFTQTTDDVRVENSQPVVTTVESNKPAENTSVLTQPAGNTTRNIQSEVNAVISNQPAVSTTDNSGNIQPSVSTVIINQPENSTVVNRSESSTIKDSQIAVTAVANNQSVEKTSNFTHLPINITETIQPTINTALNNKSMGNTSVANQPAINTSWNIQPADSAAVDNQVSNNTVFYSTETLGSVPSYPQTTNTVPPKQSAEYIGVCGQSMEGKFVFGYPTPWYGYGDVNASTGYRSSTVSSTVAQVPSVVQPINTYGLQAMGFGQSALNTTSQTSAFCRPATFYHSDAESAAHSNVHDARSTGSFGRTSAEHRSRDPRRSRFGRRAGVGSDDDSVTKKPRLESVEDSRVNYQGKAISL